ncbi:multiple C2 domain and transmembrane region protein 5-like [Lotus japonicus]|uniref:multiple C2 domain and transmembrane region protein 5-like n=1 Tax=Lotus japonicus TaxID=34305 RepID=UPI00259110ED|nr:multiple C2 domain and transmembrane region protein 5-like [Lotus japonicus]
MQKLQQPLDFSLKETFPKIGTRAGEITRDKLSCTYDLVEHMQYLYVHVVKAKNLSVYDDVCTIDPYVEVKLGNYKGSTKWFQNESNPQWNQIFAFSKDSIQASVLELAVKDHDAVVDYDDMVGKVVLDLNEIPKHDSPLAPQWYMMKNQRGHRVNGEIMLAIWMGTQADEAFPQAWHSDAAMVGLGPKAAANIRSKVYLSPSLWYLRVNVIEAQDLVPKNITRYPELFVKVDLGNQSLKTRISQRKTMNPFWNEDLMFVSSEPFEEPLYLTVQDWVGPESEGEIVGRCVIPLQNVQKRLDDKPVSTRWFNLEKHEAFEGEITTRFSSKIHLRVCFEGGYHVLDESAHCSSDHRPAAKQLWSPKIGILEVGIISAQKLMPMKRRNGQGTTDAYCVAKYGNKWIHTRTIVDSLSPKWNEQYTWDVYDPCTVITIGVFDNAHLQGGSRDSIIGKVRIRLSTLEAGKVYTHSYPLLVLQYSGLKKMGEVQLAVRFTSLSVVNMLSMYSQPLLPKMHHIHPLSEIQKHWLRYQAMQIVSMRLSRAEPPLREEVVKYMLDVDSHMWGMRRTKANYFRIVEVLGGLTTIGRWLDNICNWKSPLKTILIHIVFIILVLHPGFIPPTICMYLVWIGVRNYRWRPRHPPHMNTPLSLAGVTLDELEEEFDTFPTSRSPQVVKRRYDRLRSVSGRVQIFLGDLATQGERFHNLLSWRDPRATTLFVTFCSIAAFVLYVTPFQAVSLLSGFYVLRHPRFRQKLPSLPLNFFKRLPARVDDIM